MNFVSRQIEGWHSYFWGGSGQAEQKRGSAGGPDGRQTDTSSDTQQRAYQRNRDPEAKASVPTSLPVLEEVEEHGGLQGLGWYAAKQKQDEHGDLADEFFYEEPTDLAVGPLKPKKMKGARQKHLAVAVTSVDEGNVVLVHSKKPKK
eukprot:gene30277-35264_t